jgi:hypothetical protein
MPPCWDIRFRLATGEEASMDAALAAGLANRVPPGEGMADNARGRAPARIAAKCSKSGAGRPMGIRCARQGPDRHRMRSGRQNRFPEKPPPLRGRPLAPDAPRAHEAHCVGASERRSVGASERRSVGASEQIITSQSPPLSSASARLIRIAALVISTFSIYPIQRNRQCNRELCITASDCAALPMPGRGADSAFQSLEDAAKGPGLP